MGTYNEKEFSHEFADDLRKALNSSETEFKTFFKQFCIVYPIVNYSINNYVWDDKSIPPQNDVDNIVSAILDTAKKHDIDIMTVESIPREVRDEIFKNAKNAFEKPYKEAIIEQAKQDMSELVKHNKPIMWCENMKLFDNEREYYYNGEVSMSSKPELKIEKNAFGKLYARMNPMNAIEHFGYSQSQYGYIKDVNIVDVIRQSNYATAVITDSAIFVSCHNDVYWQTMINSYIDWLKEQGIDAPSVGGRAGYDALIECYTQQSPEYQQQLANPISEKYQFVRDLVEGMKENGPYMLLHNNGRMSIDIMKRNGTKGSKIIDDVRKGTVIMSDKITPFIDMETGEKITEGAAFNVVDKIEIGSNTILVTDYAIISERDITKELGMMMTQNQELTQDAQDVQQPEEKEDIERA